MNKRQYLLDQLSENISKFKNASNEHKRLYRYLRYAMFFLTGLSAVLAGASIKYPELNSTISLIIVFISAAIGIVTSIEGLRKPAELWIHERTLYYALTDLKREVEFNTNESTLPGLIEKYFSTMQEILKSSGEKWNHFHNNRSVQPDSKPGGQPVHNTVQG